MIEEIKQIAEDKLQVLNKLFRTRQPITKMSESSTI